jgi:toxin-antitoxin system PIN domain toxin
VVALLDINVLVALFDLDHAKHQVAHDWFDEQRPFGWATCPLTENGLVRVTTSPRYAEPAYRPGEVVEHLLAFRRSGEHRFWSDSLSLTDENIFNASFIRGHKQVTDIYLLALATAAGGAFATLDQSVPLAAVKGAKRANLLIISDAPEESRSGDR